MPFFFGHITKKQRDSYIGPTYEQCSKCLTSWHQIGNAYAIAYVLLTHAQALLTRRSCLALSLRWLTRTTVLLMPHPYKGPLV